MAKDLYDGPLNSEMDFAAAGPNGEPASGLTIQKYIKDKIGVGYYEEDTFRHLFFADEDAKLKYISNPSQYSDLIIDSIQLESMYTLKANLIDPAGGYAAVFYGSKGNYIRYNFETESKGGQIFAESVDVVYTISYGGTSVTVNESYAPSTTVSFNIDNYLSKGTTNILINIKGQASRATTTLSVRVDAISLSLTDNFDITQVYTAQDNLVVSFNFVGDGLKYLEWYVDGNQLDYDAHTDSYVVAQGSGTKYISLSGFGAGRHNLQYRMYIEVSGGARFYSNTLYRDFVVNDDTLSNTTILTKFTIPQEIRIIDAFTQPIPLNGPTQYEEYIVEYSIYSKSNKSSYPMSITFGTNENVYDLRNRVQYEYSIKEFESGNIPLVFSCEGTTLSYTALIKDSNYDIDPITGQTFDFLGSDRTNSSDNRDEWSYGDYTGELSGFKWNENSGWNNGRLVVSDGDSFITNYAPFANNIKGTGFTFEMEFETTRVLDENAVILDLTNNGGGLKITASEITFKPDSAVTLNTRYKPEEDIRVSIVVNPILTEINPRMMFIYIDGILTGAAQYAPGDSFISNETIKFIGGSGATMHIKQIVTYPKPLTHNEILNNFIVHRDTVDELVDTYDRNDVYIENTEIMSADKLATKTPIIIITGNVNKLQNFTEQDKKTYVKMDKIEVINNADPTRNLTLINASMRCQGTSSMAYPRKNFRFYTQADSKDETVPKYTTRMFDWQGKEITGKQRLYSFKEGSQPVKCWCLKADYAESSSTHNTGVARMWNDYMKNIRIPHNEIDDRFYLKTKYEDRDNWNTPCKTIAQQCAEDNNYEYDVRTTVDGFPITLFYHEHENEPLIFLGKYNWNNDKSTESVFGFKDIPGFEPYKNTMECWEVVNGDKDINQFISMDGWAAGKDHGGWQDSFESRYPDDSGKSSEAARAEHALKRVCTWICSTNGASKVDPETNKIVVDNPVLMEKFKTGDPEAERGEGGNGKWDFLDVYKVAAYYVYLMRFGAVDQTVKNAMFTTEDGKHWYYINYDNDTINGVRNDGALKFGYLIDRQSKDPDNPNAYCYAGHASVLWNNLEADDEFMNIVKRIDQALYTAGMSYSSVINMFNDKQSAQWSERTHNEDYNYKYIDISDRTQLTKLQGPRKSHRQWWLSHRFAAYDAINGTDAYLGNRIAIKPLSADLGTNEYVTVTPAADGQIFGFGYQTPVQLGVIGHKGVPIQFDMSENYYVGTTIKFYNAVYFKEINISKISQYVNEIDLTLVNSAAFNSELSSFILGDLTSQPNTSMETLNGLSNLKYLENFQMNGYNAIGSIDLSGNNYLKTVDVRNCINLSSIELPPASPLETLKLPASTTSLNLNNYPYLNTVEVQGNSANVNSITSINCPNFTDDPTFFLNWLDNKVTPDKDCTVYMDNINWENIDIDDLHRIGQFILNADPQKTGKITLIGRASLISIRSAEDAAAFMEEFGENVFSPSASFYIVAPPALYIIGRTEILEGENEQYSLATVGIEEGGTELWQILSGTKSHNESLNKDTGLFTTTETGAATETFSIRCIYTDPHGHSYTAPDHGQFNIQVKQRIYPNSNQVNIIGNTSIEVGQTNNYTFEYTIEGVTGEMTADWTLTGDLAQYASLISYGMNGCSVTLNDTPSLDVVSGNVTLVLNKVNQPGQTITPTPLQIGYIDDTVAVSRLTNPYAMEALYNGLHNKGLCESPDKMTKTEAMLVTADDLNPGSSYNSSIFYNCYNFRRYCTNFDEFKYFTGVTVLKLGLFTNCWFESIVLPEGLTTIQGNNGDGGAFYNCTKLTSIELPSSVTSIQQRAFQNCTGLTHITFNCDVPDFALNVNTSISPFYNCSNINSVTLNEGVTSIGNNAFTGRNWLTSIELPSSVTSIGNGAFQTCIGLTSIELSSGLISIGSQSFSGCTGLTSIELPSSVTTIGSSAFQNCIGLTSIELPSSLTSIGNGAFYSCTGLTHVTFNCDVPDYALFITNGTSPFYNCSNINSVTLNEGVTKIGYQAFQNCTGLTSIELPSSLTSIDYNAFQNCTGLTSINIPSGVTSIGNNVFYGCSGLETITIDSNNTTYYDGGEGGNCIVQRSNNTLLCGCKNTTIPSSVTSIGFGAFYGCTGLTSIELPSSLTSISNQSFYGCTRLTSIELPSSLTSISNSAFYGCTGLTSIELPSSLTSISNSAFQNCTGLTHVTFNCNVPNYALYINASNSPFYNCSNINSVTLNEGVAKIGYIAFYDCLWLTSIELPSSLTMIDNQSFYSCANLHIITSKPTTPPSIQSSTLPGTNIVQHIYVPSESISSYKGASNWNTYSSVIDAIQ